MDYRRLRLHTHFEIETLSGKREVTSSMSRLPSPLPKKKRGRRIGDKGPHCKQMLGRLRGLAAEIGSVTYGAAVQGGYYADISNLSLQMTALMLHISPPSRLQITGNYAITGPRLWRTVPARAGEGGSRGAEGWLGVARWGMRSGGLPLILGCILAQV